MNGSTIPASVTSRNGLTGIPQDDYFLDPSQNQSIAVVVGRTGNGLGDGTGTEGSTVRAGNGTGPEIPTRQNRQNPPRRVSSLTRPTIWRHLHTRAPAQAPERSGEIWEKCPEKARSRSGHALVASWSR